MVVVVRLVGGGGCRDDGFSSSVCRAICLNGPSASTRFESDECVCLPPPCATHPSIVCADLWVVPALGVVAWPTFLGGGGGGASLACALPRRCGRVRLASSPPFSVPPILDPALPHFPTPPTHTILGGGIPSLPLTLRQNKLFPTHPQMTPPPRPRPWPAASSSPNVSSRWGKESPWAWAFRPLHDRSATNAHARVAARATAPWARGAAGGAQRGCCSVPPRGDVAPPFLFFKGRQAA